MQDVGFVHILVDGETSFLVKTLSSFSFLYLEVRRQPGGSVGERNRPGFHWSKII